MRRIACIMLLLGLAPPFALAQSGSRRIERELLQIEGDLTRAILRRDIALFERLLDDDYVFTDSGGKLTAKADLLKAMKSGDVINETYELSDLRVRVYGNAGVVTGRSRTRWRAGDAGFTDEDRFTDVFVRRGRNWRLVASQTTRLSRQ